MDVKNFEMAFKDWDNDSASSQSDSQSQSCASLPSRIDWENFPLYRPYDQLPVGNSLIRPKDFVCKITCLKWPNFESRKINKRNECYYVTERSGREVFVGKIKITNKLVVNPHGDGTFECLSCVLRCEGLPENRLICIPYNKLVKQEVLSFMFGFRRNIDCPDAYVKAAFFEELLDGDDMQFFSTPEHSGWNKVCDRWAFASAESILPHLSAFYPTDISERQLERSDLSLQDAAKQLASLLPDDWRCVFLLAYSTASLLLPFYAAAGFQPDRILILRPDTEQAAKLATVLLSTRNYTSTAACALTANRQFLDWELESMWDGTCVFRDTSCFDSVRKRNSGFEVLLQDLERGQGINEVPRHMIALISDNPGLSASELPAVCMEFNDCPVVENLERLQHAIGAFQCALIRQIVIADNPVIGVLEKSQKMQASPDNLGLIGTENIVCYTLRILERYGVISSHKSRCIIQFERDDDTFFDSSLRLINDFRTVLSKLIEDGEVRVINQRGGGFFRERHSAVLDSEYINLTIDILNKVVAEMKTTKRRNIVLKTMESCGKLYSNNAYKRHLDVETRPGIIETIAFYSFPKSLLTAACQAKLSTIGYRDYLFPSKSFPEGFYPLLRARNGCAAGRVICQAFDIAESVYVSGQTRSGKTFLLIQQAVIRAANGDTVVILDQTGAFSEDELCKHLSAEIIAEWFSFWELGTKGLPINLLSLEGLNTLPDMKNRLASILSVLARLTGEVQLKTMRSCMSKLARAIEAGSVHSLFDTIRFFDTTDPAQEEIVNRLQEAFGDFEGLPVSQESWADFLSSQGRIIVISSSDDGIRKTAQHFDALLASLYAFKQHSREDRMTIVLDEIEDLCLEKEGPVSTILRKGGKHRLSMYLASQEFSVEKDLLGKIIGNCGTKVIFRPKDADISAIARHIGVATQQLASLEQGEFWAVGEFFSRSRQKNCARVISGKAYTSEAYLSVRKKHENTSSDRSHGTESPN